MWYKNIVGRFFGLVTKHACDRQTDGRIDRQTDRITAPKTALAQLRCAVKTTKKTKTDTDTALIMNTETEYLDLH